MIRPLVMALISAGLCTAQLFAQQQSVDIQLSTVGGSSADSGYGVLIQANTIDPQTGGDVNGIVLSCTITVTPTIGNGTYNSGTIIITTPTQYSTPTTLPPDYYTMTCNLSPTYQIDYSAYPASANFEIDGNDCTATDGTTQDVTNSPSEIIFHFAALLSPDNPNKPGPTDGTGDGHPQDSGYYDCEGNPLMLDASYPPTDQSQGYQPWGYNGVEFSWTITNYPNQNVQPQGQCSDCSSGGLYSSATIYGSVSAPYTYDAECGSN